MSILTYKLKALFVHVLISASVVALILVFVLRFWFPYQTFNLLNGFQLFILIVACDAALGPLLSFVVYNPKKRRSEKIVDFAVIALIQLIGMAYGLHAAAQNRLSFVVFAGDRYELVSAGEMDAADLKKAPQSEWRTKSYLKHHVVYADLPRNDSPEFMEYVMKGLDGKDIQYFPERYRSLDSALPKILPHIQSMEALPLAKRQRINTEASQHKGEIGWLPVSFQRKFWTLLVDKATARPISAVAIDPYP